MYESIVLQRDIDWKPRDLDVYHAGMDYTDFTWKYFYPYLVTLYNRGFNITLFTPDHPYAGVLSTPAMVIGYAMSPLPVGCPEMYPNLSLRAIMDIDISALTDEIDSISFILHRDADDTTQIVDEFDINICRLRMIWTLDDNFIFSKTCDLHAAIVNKIMAVFYGSRYVNDTATTRRTELRRLKYETRGYATGAVHYPMELYNDY